MKVAFFSAKPYDRRFFDAANADRRHEIVYLEARLNAETAALAQGAPAACVFVNDQVDSPALEALTSHGVRMLALRSAGYNHVDVRRARELELKIGYVPNYSPYAVAEHTLTLILALNRKIHRAYARSREGNFSIDGLLGFDLNGRIAGLIGAGKIGLLTARALRGFGCEVLAFDPQPPPEPEKYGIRMVSLDELLERSNIISLHCPLNPKTFHLIDAHAIARMQPGVMLINTSRGGLIDTRAVIDSLKSGRIGYLGIDVYEEERDIFYEDLSSQVIPDDVFMRLLTFPNVIVTSHQGFFTADALTNIAETTLQNITRFEQGHPPAFEVPS